MKIFPCYAKRRVLQHDQVRSCILDMSSEDLILSTLVGREIVYRR